VAPKTRRSASERGSTGRRYPEEPLSHERIVSTAWPLSTKRAARSLHAPPGDCLGRRSMAIYYYLPNRAALEDASSEAVNVDMYADELSFDFSLPCTILWWRQGASIGRPAAPSQRCIPHGGASRATPTARDQATTWWAGSSNGVSLLPRASRPLTSFPRLSRPPSFGSPTAGRAGRRPTSAAKEDEGGAGRGEFPNLVRAISEGNLKDFDAEFEFGLQALAVGSPRSRPNGRPSRAEWIVTA